MFLRKNNIIILFYLIGGLLHCYTQASTLSGIKNNMDHYSWMETDKKRTTQWLNFRTSESRKTIDALPWRVLVEKRLNALVSVEDTFSDTNDTRESSFYLRSTSEFPYQRLFVKISDKREKLLISPPPGSGINFFSPSYNGMYVAYGLSQNGSETTSIQIVNVYDGRSLKELIPQVRNPNVVWNSDNHSFYYTKNKTSEVNSPQVKRLVCGGVYLHRIGQRYEDDMVVFDKGMISKINLSNCESVSLYTSPNSDYLITFISPLISGYGGDIYSSRKETEGIKKNEWSKIVDASEGVPNFVLSGKWLYIAKYNLFSGYTISRLDLERESPSEEKIIEWSNGELTGLTTSSDSLYITYRDSGKSRFVRILFSDIHDIQNVPIPFEGVVTDIFSSYARKEIRFTIQNWVKPERIFLYSPENKTVKDTNIVKPKASSFSDYEADEKWVKSQDNVLVPMTIIHRRGMSLDGTAPTWLTTYGAYGVSTFPYFDPSRLIWLENGGVIAIAHVRGGGELGPGWHESGRASKKENSINDFISCADYLVDKHYTNPSKLVASGESAGGVIIGMAMIYRPRLFSAVAIDVGILNISRLDKIPIGPMNYKEFGSPFTAQGMHDLLKIDAYHNLKSGVRYPAVMLTVGLNDERVSPWQTAKFAAKLESINKEWKVPVIILADGGSGHSSSTYEQNDAKFIDILSFFIWRTSGKSAP